MTGSLLSIKVRMSKKYEIMRRQGRYEALISLLFVGLVSIRVELKARRAGDGRTDGSRLAVTLASQMLLSESG